MIIISDNSALSALAEAGLIDLLHRLFGIIVIPESVRQEACHRSAPAELHQWISAPPDWLFIVNDPTHSYPRRRDWAPAKLLRSHSLRRIPGTPA